MRGKLGDRRPGSFGRRAPSLLLCAACLWGLLSAESTFWKRNGEYALRCQARATRDVMHPEKAKRVCGCEIALTFARSSRVLCSSWTALHINWLDFAPLCRSWVLTDGC